MSAAECIEPSARRLITHSLAAELSANEFQHDQLKRAHSLTSSSERFLSFNFIDVRKHFNFSLTNGFTQLQPKPEDSSLSRASFS